MIARCILVLLFAFALIGVATAGPPFVSDDPEPTDYQHYEIYVFSGGTHGRDANDGASGIDFNYGATEDVQLTAVLPIAYDHPSGGKNATGLGNIELAVKYRFLHKADTDWDVAVFPRLFLPSPSSRFGEKHFSLLVPIWLERDWADWSTFGGGGCVINRGSDSQDFCLAGWALARQVTPKLQLGAELVHQTADTKDGSATTRIGGGFRYDINDRYHVLAYVGPSLQNVDQTDRYLWYASVLLTF